jgi:hypothetical protein
MHPLTENYASGNLAVSKATNAGWVLSEVPDKEIYPSPLDWVGCGGNIYTS